MLDRNEKQKKKVRNCNNISSEILAHATLILIQQLNGKFDIRCLENSKFETKNNYFDNSWAL